MSMRVRNLLPILLPLACFLAGDGVHTVHGAGSLVAVRGAAGSHAVSGPHRLGPPVRREGTIGGARLPASRPAFPKRRRLRDDDSNDGAPCAANHFDNAKWKVGMEARADLFIACAIEKENRRVLLVLFPERGSGIVLSALCSSLLLSRPPPAASGFVLATPGAGSRREFTEIS